MAAPINLLSRLLVNSLTCYLVSLLLR